VSVPVDGILFIPIKLAKLLSMFKTVRANENNNFSRSAVIYLVTLSQRRELKYKFIVNNKFIIINSKHLHSIRKKNINLTQLKTSQ